MEENNRFCTIEIHPGRKEFDCTVKINKNGAQEPKDVWYFDRWVSINRVMKLENCRDATFLGFRHDI